MTSINDFGSTYMCQSLPFGGVKDSGFDRFAGIEGLRGLCIPKAVCQDRSAHHFVSEQLAQTVGYCKQSDTKIVYMTDFACEGMNDTAHAYAS